MAFKVWIDQDECTGSQVCVKKAPSVFVMRDGKAYVQQDGVIVGEGGPDALADTPEDMTDTLAQVAEECEGQCIFLEIA